MIYTPVLPSWKTASKQSSASQENPHSMEAKTPLCPSTLEEMRHATVTRESVDIVVDPIMKFDDVRPLASIP